MPDSPASVPATVCHYAAYLQARAHVTPETSVGGSHAELRLSAGGKMLVAVFGCRKKKWSLRSAEVRGGGEQAAAYTRGELAKAMAALLSREPQAPAPEAINAASGRAPTPSSASGALSARPC
jgi:hypothetical protein